MKKWHVAIAAEAIAAAQFARLGFDVSVQYGANQPEYDLMIDNGEKTLKVSVKGTYYGRKDWGWMLSQSELKKVGNANYHAAANAWAARYKPRTILCLVQFGGVALDIMPKIYLATPKEIAKRLREAAGGRGDTILYENFTRGPKAAGKGTSERLPDRWLLSAARVNELMVS